MTDNTMTKRYNDAQDTIQKTKDWTTGIPLCLTYFYVLEIAIRKLFALNNVNSIIHINVYQCLYWLINVI
jgi:hypothetical protein